jgi:putative PEP-CTERM system histidine kinase
MDSVAYVIHLILLLSCWFDQRSQKADQRVALILLRTIVSIPLLAATLGLNYFLGHERWVPLLFFSENILSLFMLLLAFRLRTLVTPDASWVQTIRWTIRIAAAAVVAMGLGWWWRAPAFETSAAMLTIPHYGPLYFSALFTLLAGLILAWRLELFWRMLGSRAHWQYKYLVLGFFLVIGSLVWSTSYRLTYLHLVGEHLLLLALLLITAWFLIVYAVARHRLLNRRLFVSRKVVYSALVPSIFAGYLIALGLTSLLLRTLGWTLPFVAQWLLIILGLLGITVVALFKRVRGKVKYFISTHFYLSKYEYRDEWLAFSKLLQGAVSEKEVVNALQHILQECLYTQTIRIWLGDREHGFQLFGIENSQDRKSNQEIAPGDPLIAYLQNNPYLYADEPHEGPSAQEILDQKRPFFQANAVVLMAALIASDQYLGLIGLGPEYTGGQYGRDDFDLLAALGTQAASALLAARNAETLAHLREQSAWQTLSAFVLHDIKNAATMLGLVQQNAPRHIHDPAFQQDMLASIEDALKRMNKVQIRLKTLKGELVPVLSPLDLGLFLKETIWKLSKKLPQLRVAFACPDRMTIQTDPDFLTQIIENLLLNALEARGNGGDVTVKIAVTQVSPQEIEITLSDNGPGIPPMLLLDRLFEPFATTKEKGSGIGLWQVKCLVESLGGAITAGNIDVEGGACFRLRLPIPETENAASK